MKTCIRSISLISILFLLTLGTAWAEEPKPLDPPSLSDVEKKGIKPVERTPLSTPNLPVLEREVIKPPERAPFLTPKFPDVEPSTVLPPKQTSLPTLQLPEVGPLEVFEFNDFRGGLNLRSYKTHLQPNQALELKNALWTKEGELVKRPGYDTLKTTPEPFNFLYRYYQQDGDKYLMGGSDTALYFWQEDSSEWTYLIGTSGTSGRWDGTTFEDMFVATHQGITPIAWDGEDFITIGASIDSYLVFYTEAEWTVATACTTCSTRISVPVEDAGWTTNEWTEYIFASPARAAINETDYDTITQKNLILWNTDHKLYLRAAGWNILEDHYGQIYSWFDYQNYRSGKIDSTWSFGDPYVCTIKLFDFTYYWDSTTNWNDYVFEVTGGTGEGKKCFLTKWFYGTGVGWDTTGFMLVGYGADCFDTTTEYRIYQPSFWTGSKFVENFDRRLWFGWTGTGEEQNKNRVVYSEVADLGHFALGSDIWIESDDGDYITGMIQMYSDQGGFRDIPYPELVVTKNNSLYKILSTATAGLYNTFYIAKNVGCCSNSALASIDGRFLCIPDQHGVFAYDGNKVLEKPISFFIDPIFEAMPLADVEDMSAIYNPEDRHYYLSYSGFYDESYPDGGFIVAFEMDSAGIKDGYFVHQIGADGNETGDDIYKFYYTAGDYIDISTKGDGEYAIMYKRSSGATGYKVFLAFFDSTGAQIGDTLRIDDGGDVGYAKNADHKFDMNNTGQIVACWTDQEDGNNDIRCQCVDFDTGLVGANFDINSDHASNTADYASWGVGINESGIAVMAWHDQRDVPGITEIYAQRFQYPDSLMGSNFRVNKCWTWNGSACVPCVDNPVCNGANCCENEFKPAVAVGTNTFVIAWVSSAVGPHARCAGQSCLYKRAYNIDGTAREGEFLVSDCVGGSVQEPSISMNLRGNYVIAYDKECTEESYSIYMTAFDSTDNCHLDETQVAPHDSNAQGPDVAINNADVFTVVWYDAHYDANVEIAYRSYDWSGRIISDGIILSSSAYCQYPEIDCFLSPIDTGTYCLAWNVDYHGWSKETFKPGAFCYQHSITDNTKILFSDESNNRVCSYGTQADDVDDPVILEYQSPYFSFVSNPSYEAVIKYGTIEAYLDTGTIYVDWYRNYSHLTYQDSVLCGEDCRKEMQLPDTLYGHNISMKITTGSQINDFTLSKVWWEYLINPIRK